MALATQVVGAVLDAAGSARITPVASEQNARVPVAVTPEKVAGAAPVTYAYGDAAVPAPVGVASKL